MEDMQDLPLVPVFSGHRTGVTRTIQQTIQEKNVSLTALNDIKRPKIDYEKLKYLCAIPDIGEGVYGSSSEDAHELFMQHYQEIFFRTEKMKALPSTQDKSSKSKPLKSSSLPSVATVVPSRSTNTGKDATKSMVTVAQDDDHEDEEESHDIGKHLAKLHLPSQKKQTQQFKTNTQMLRYLKNVASKLPLDKTPEEINTMIDILLQLIPSWKRKIAREELRELCMFAIVEEWPEKGLEMFGQSGVYVVLSGCIGSFDNAERVSRLIRAVVNTQDRRGFSQVYKPGDYFGDIFQTTDPGFGGLNAMTLEESVILNITTADYQRISREVKVRDESTKIHLIRAVRGYELWPQNALTRLAGGIEWIEYPENIVLASEGFRAPFVAFIRSGSCHILRQVEAIETLKNKQQVRKIKQVVIGKVNEGESFGEISVANGDKMPCSIVSETPVKLGIVRKEKVEEMGEVVRQQLEMMEGSTVGLASKDQVEKEYVKQEQQRQWNEFKHHVVLDVINSRGILPGASKWSELSKEPAHGSPSPPPAPPKANPNRQSPTD